VGGELRELMSQVWWSRPPKGCRWVFQKQGDFLSPPFELGLFGKELGVTAN